MRISPHLSREFCLGPVAQASACVVLICAGAEKSTQTEVCATACDLALRLISAQKPNMHEPTRLCGGEKCGRDSSGFDFKPSVQPRVCSHQ
jgi:hypothetical protein